MSTQYRKKPVVIEAFKLGHDNMPDWFMDKFTANAVTIHNTDGRCRGGPDYALIKTLEGEMRAEFGDWIIRGVKGELYPCKPDIFAATYESAATVAEPSAANLEGLAKALMAPREIVRDADGWLDHPALPVCDEGVRFDMLLDAFGLETYFRAMDGDIDCDEYDRIQEAGEGCSGWTPTPPDGDGWKLITIYDTEDGPYAMFAREKQLEPRKRYGKAAQQQPEPCPESAMCPACYYGEPMESCIGKQAEPGADERAAVDPMTQALPFAILADEMKALRRFHECATDDESYDVSKDMMKRLSEIGLVRRVTSNIYEHTDFGLAVLNGDFAAQSGQREGAAEGWQMVPIEPTPEMLEQIKFLNDITDRAMTARYKAMLAAAPTQQQGVGS